MITSNIVEDPDMIVDDAVSITNDDLAEIEKRNQTPPTPVLECVHEAFSRHARSTPNAPAIAS
jgi:hypothetical protein